MDGRRFAGVGSVATTASGQQFCVYSICMQVRSIIPVVGTLSENARCQGFTPGRWNSWSLSKAA